MVKVNRSTLIAAGGALVIAMAASLSASGNASEKATVVELTQVPCQFIEPEAGVDHGYMSKMKSDCETINAKSGDQRVAANPAMMLKPGKYIFRVTNKNVTYPLGFWLREKDYDWRNPLHKLSKISVSGGGLDTGVTKDYAVELKPGEYLFSCPLNTTPDYKLVVAQ